MIRSRLMSLLLLSLSTILLFSFSAKADWIDSNGLQWKPAVSTLNPGTPYRLATFNEVAELVAGVTDYHSSLEFFKRIKAKPVRGFSRFGSINLHYALLKDADDNTWQIRDALTCQPWPNNNICATEYVKVFPASQNLGGVPLYVTTATTDGMTIKSPLEGNVNGLVIVDVDSISTQPVTVLISFNDGSWVPFCTRVPCSFSTLGALPGKRKIKVEQSEDFPRLGEVMDADVEIVFTN